MSYTYTNDTNNTVNITNIFQAGSSATMTKYTINNGSDLTFLQPFTSGNTASAGNTSTYAARLPGYQYNSALFQFCPKYDFYAGTAYYTDSTTFGTFDATVTKRADRSITAQTIPLGVKRMLAVCIGAGGGGGGGGAEDKDDSSGESDAGGGAGGGGGAMFSQMFTVVSSATTYTCSIGSGGIYGQPNNRSSALLKPGKEDNDGNLKRGTGGGIGGNTTFTYNSTTITANGGYGGTGGKSNTDSDTTTVASGGAGGSVTAASLPLIRSGADGAQTDCGGGTNGQAIPGGIGGQSGNISTSYGDGYFINTTTIPLVSSQWTNTGSNSTTLTTLSSSSNEVTAFYLKYGEGGHGGMGDANGAHYGFAGEVGAPGCVIVFYYYT